jgi:ribonuclease J
MTLAAPGEGRAPALEIVPLGGLGEFGMNMMAVSWGETLVLIDAGVMFPDPELLGVDLVIPDLAYLEQRPVKAAALVLTHGHEDHIGAVPHVLGLVDGPIYASPFTLALVKSKLERHGLAGEARLVPVAPRGRVRVGELEIEFLRVTHSIPDALAVAIRTPAGTVVHTGDFKIDQTPLDGQAFDFQRFAELGAEGVLALLADSTNIERPGFTGSEYGVVEAFEELFASTRGKLVVTSFATSIYRMQILANLAVEFGRKLALVGRGMIEHAQVAQDLGHLQVPPGVLIREADVRSYPARQVLCVTTGSQGEPMAALSRIALATHRHVSVEPGDRVVFSARAIPGNERAIDRMVNHLARRGADVVTGADRHVHVSGHGSEEELKLMLSLVRPRYFVPIHGEFRQRSRYARLAERLLSSAGGTTVTTIVAENGDRLRFDGTSGGVAGQVQTGRVLIDGPGLGEVGDEVLRDRRHLAEDGLIVPVVAINKQTGLVEGQPDIITRGLVLEPNPDELLAEAARVVGQVLAETSDEERTNRGLVSEKIRVELGRCFKKRAGRRPLVLPVIMEI